MAGALRCCNGRRRGLGRRQRGLPEPAHGPYLVKTVGKRLVVLPPAEAQSLSFLLLVRRNGVRRPCGEPAHRLLDDIVDVLAFLVVRHLASRPSHSQITMIANRLGDPRVLPKNGSIRK